MNVATFHYTQAIMDLLRKSKVTTALIPPSYTYFLQPLDTTINKAFKQWLREATNEYIVDREERFSAFKKWSFLDKRIIIMLRLGRNSGHAKKREAVGRLSRGAT